MENKTKVIITNDRHKVDTLEVNLPNKDLAKNGIIDEELQGKINECVNIINDLSDADKSDEKKETIEEKESVSILKFKNVVNWRTYGYYGKLQHMEAMNDYMMEYDTILNKFDFKQFYNPYRDSITFKLELRNAIC